MVKGKKKQELLTYEELLRRTNGGFDIIMHYHGSTPRRCKSPFRNDKNPSFGFVFRNGIIFWKDLAEELSGTAVEYVQKKFNLTFTEAIEKIKWDFGWSEKQINVNPIKVTWEKPKQEENPTLISVDSQPFTKKHHEYWNRVEVTEKDCNRLECWAIKSPFAVNRKMFRLRKDEVGFFYYAPEEERYKIYLPERSKENRFLNNVSGSHIWYLSNYKRCDNLIIAKSNKDAITLSTFGLCVAATQNEGFHCVEPNVEWINSVANQVYIAYGNDPQGWEASYKITKAFNWRHFNIPQKELEKGIIDPYDYAKAYGAGKLKELLKSKNLI